MNEHKGTKIKIKRDWSSFDDEMRTQSVEICSYKNCKRKCINENKEVVYLPFVLLSSRLKFLR